MLPSKALAPRDMPLTMTGANHQRTQPLEPQCQRSSFTLYYHFRLITSAACHRARLPLELQAEIIDVHQHNFHQLRSLAHVCKSWRHRCNRSLFRRIQLTPTTVHLFSSILASPFSAEAIVEHASHLWIGGHGDRPGDWDASRMEVLQEILVALEGARKLGELTLLQGVSELFQLGFITLLPLHLPRVQSLHLADIDFATPGEFAGFLNGFASVQYIVLKDVTVPNSRSALTLLETAGKVAPSGSRFALSFHFNQDGTVRRCLRWVPSSRATRIALRDVAVLYSSSLRRLSAGIDVVIGQEITHIEVLAKQCPYSRDRQPWLCPTARMDISTACSLRYITLGSSRSVLSLLTWVPVLLSQVPPSAPVKEVRIAFASSRQFDLDQPFLKWLASTLSGDRRPFHALQSIYFMAYGTLGNEEIEENISTTVLKEFESRADVVKFSFSA